jgi:hypothetical protein
MHARPHFPGISNGFRALDRGRPKHRMPAYTENIGGLPHVLPSAVRSSVRCALHAVQDRAALPALAEGDYQCKGFYTWDALVAAINSYNAKNAQAPRPHAAWQPRAPHPHATCPARSAAQPNEAPHRSLWPVFRSPHAHKLAHIPAHKHKGTHARALSSVLVCVCVWLCACVWVCVRVRVREGVSNYVTRKTHMHTHRHTHTHTSGRL